MRLFWVPCKMEILRIMRNRRFILASLMMPILFYYIFTNIAGGQTDNKAWHAQYLISMTAFSMIGSAVNTLGLRMVQERSFGWVRLIQITPLPAGAYLASKMIAQTVVNAFTIVCIFLAGFLINHVQLQPMQWIGSGLWILVGSLPFMALGTLIGSMKSMDTAAGIGNMLYMILSILGGLWMPLEVMPKLLRQIGEWLPTYRFGHGAWNIVAGKSPDFTSVAVLAGYLLLFVVLSVYIRKRQEAV